MDHSRQKILIKFGFKFGKSGAHSRRTMMLAELQLLFPITSLSTSLEQYANEVIEHNCLNKPTKNARKYAFRPLVELYGFDIKFPLFRVLRQLWDTDPEAQPVLALQLTYARDPLFRMSSDFILSHKPGERIYREEVEEVIKKNDPDRFSPTSLSSVAKNVNSSWTQAGFLKGKAKKIRQIPIISPINVIYALFQGYLHGLSGERLFNTPWMKLLNLPFDQLKELTAAASYRGLIDYKESGGVIEVRFNDYLNSDEQLLLQELLQAESGGNLNE